MSVDSDRKSFLQKVDLISKDIRSNVRLEKGTVKSDHTRGVYEDHWGKRLPGLVKNIENGEHFSTILAQMRKHPHLIKQRNRVSGYISKHFLEDVTLFNGTDAPVSRIEVSNSRFNIGNNIDQISFLIEKINKFPYVVELGSGPGWNIFELYQMLGMKGRDHRFFALEFTESGRKVYETIAAIVDGLEVESHYFNYLEPDISMIPDDQPTLFFSNHSIEQVEDISPDIFEQILNRKSHVEVVHFEPVGWQRDAILSGRRLKGDDSFFRALISQRLNMMDDANAVVINAAINSWRLGYNRNFFSIMANLKKEKKIKSLHEYFDFTNRFNTNPVNPTTLVNYTRN
ncbi:MAG: hypothetical protein GY927_06615 [bacterium]|nr:hypothetical protein [bacterium]